MVTLTQRAQQRLVILNALERGELMMAEAATLVGLSVRQLRRIRRAYRRWGAQGLVEGSRGRPSPAPSQATLPARGVRPPPTPHPRADHPHLTPPPAQPRVLRLLAPAARAHAPPRALHPAPHGLFKPRAREPLTLEVQLRARPEPTQVGRTLVELGSQWVPATSSQAKGRLERVGGTFQDRLVSELRLARIRDLDGANAFLSDYIARHNRRFAHPAAEAPTAFRSIPPSLDLDTICCFKYLRTVENDNTVSLGPHRLQILPDNRRRSYARARVEAHERLDGTLAVFAQGQRLP